MKVIYNCGIYGHSEYLSLCICAIHTHTSFRTCIHTVSSSKLLTTQGLANMTSSAITALVQSPAIDVVGVGFTSGEVSVYDIRADERLMRMFMEGGAIRGLSFRNGWYPALQITIPLIHFHVRWSPSSCLSVFSRASSSLGLELWWSTSTSR